MQIDFTTSEYAGGASVIVCGRPVAKIAFGIFSASRRTMSGT